MSRALSLCALLLPAFAFGAEVARDESTGAVLEVSGFYKSLLQGVVLNGKVVELSRAQAKLLADATGASTPTIPDGGFLNAHLARVSSRFRIADKFELDVAWQLQLALVSDPVLAGGLSSTVGGTSSGAQRRLVELAGVLGQGSAWSISHNLDRLAVKIALPFGDLTVGRQVLSWGTGRLWNPTDVLSPFPPTVVDREVRRGFDAVRLAIALGEVTQLDLLYLPQPKLEDQGGVARFQTNTRGWDWSLSAGKYVGDLVFGADVVGDLGPIGVHAEGAYTVQLKGLGGGPVSVGEHFFRGVIGAEARPHEKLLLMLEYSYNGYGSANPSRYAAILSSARVQRGEIFGAGKHQAALAANFLATEALTASLSVLANLSDPSAMVIPTVEYSVTQNVLLRGGLYVPIGRPPDPNVARALSTTDVLSNSAAWQQLVATRGLRSEYGASSFGAFVQIGIYAP